VGGEVSMKEVTKEFTFILFEKGDYVRTPEGMGIVHKNESRISKIEDFIYHNIKVKHKTGTSSNPSNYLRELPRDLVLLSTKEEYDAEEY
jgi:hypothetical protein